MENLKFTAIIQARYNSTRFRGKILKKINGLSILELLIKRLYKSKELSSIIVACSKNKNDEKIIAICKKLKIRYFRGSEQNVLNRYYLAAKKFKIENIVRITSDCPLLDPLVVDNLIKKFKTRKNIGYAANTIIPSYPDGQDVEIFTFKVLKEANFNVKSMSDKEHVTPYIIRSKNIKKYNLSLKKNYSKLRITLDTAYDLYIINKVLSYFKNNIYVNLDQILNLYEIDKNFFEKNSNKERNMDANLNLGQKMWIRANNVFPGGTMLFSKNPDLYLPNKWPAYFSKTKKCNIWDLENNKYIDLHLMGVGTNILGYSNEKIDKAVIKGIKNGNMSTLNSLDEIILAEKLIDIHPWSEMARFTRSGGEANAVAIRIARACSGKDNIAICGYHGWHDWYLSANLSSKSNLNQHLIKDLEISGVPKKLKNTIFSFEYNNFKQLEQIVNNNNIGVIKMEVERNEVPKNNFLKQVRELANKKNIVLIFDECTSGFRKNFGGLHLLYNVNPDILILGKALGNGYAINAILGKRNVMEHSKKTFISSTFWTERIGPIAANKTLEIMAKLQSWEIITKIGKKIKKNWRTISNNHSIKLNIYGLDALARFDFNSKNNQLYKTFLSQEMLKKKFLASNTIYSCIYHNDKILNEYFEHLDEIFKKIKDCEKGIIDINDILETNQIKSGIRA